MKICRSRNPPFRCRRRHQIPERTKELICAKRWLRLECGRSLPRNDYDFNISWTKNLAVVKTIQTNYVIAAVAAKVGDLLVSRGGEPDNFIWTGECYTARS